MNGKGCGVIVYLCLCVKIPDYYVTNPQARKARLDALENDAATIDDEDLDDPDDEEFVLEDSDEEFGDDRRKKRKKKGGRSKRNTRVSLTGKGRGPKTLQDWIDQDGLEEFPDYEPTYLTAVAAPAKTRSVRYFCSVCGQRAGYTCVRCGTRFCCVKCAVVHNETRCLKFTA